MGKGVLVVDVTPHHERSKKRLIVTASVGYHEQVLWLGGS